MKTNTFINICAGGDESIEFPMEYTIVNRIMWKIVTIFAPIKIRWFW